MNLFLPEDCEIYSCDFESLYTNIDVLKLITITCESVAPLLSNSKYINLYAFREILKLFLHNNAFKYNNRFFIQFYFVFINIKTNYRKNIVCFKILQGKYVTYHLQWFLFKRLSLISIRFYLKKRTNKTKERFLKFLNYSY